MEITDQKNDEIMEIINNNTHEYRSGQLYCTPTAINNIASILGLDYRSFGKHKRERFRVDLISAYQNKYFTLTIDYTK